MSPVAMEGQLFPAWIVTGIFAGLLSYFGCKGAMLLASWSGMIVQPGDRQSHGEATPTGGGLGLVASTIITAMLVQIYFPLPVFWWQGVLPGVVVLTIIGWLDDRRPVSSLLRLLVQLAVSLWLIGFVCSQVDLYSLLWCVNGVLAVLWVMNLYNFMDGSNGMAGFQGVFSGLVLGFFFYLDNQYSMTLLSTAVAAACAGFLPLNFPRAKIFMGDVASVPLGFIFASLAIYGILSGALGLASSLLVMSVFFVDTTLTLLARAIRGERWYTAHNQHVYQRLIAKGWSHSRVLVAYQITNLVLVLPAIVLAEIYPANAVLIVGSALLALSACWYSTNLKLDALGVGETE